MQLRVPTRIDTVLHHRQPVLACETYTLKAGRQLIG
jgi:hypothetical protein